MTEMVMEVECPSVCVALPPSLLLHSPGESFSPSWIALSMNHFSPPLSAAAAAAAPGTELDLVNVRILSQFWCQFMETRVQSYELDGLSGEILFYSDLIPNFPFSNLARSHVF